MTAALARQRAKEFIDELPDDSIDDMLAVMKSAWEMTLRARRPQPKELLDMSKMTEEEIDAELEKGYQDMLAGREIPIDVAVAEMKKKYGIEL